MKIEPGLYKITLNFVYLMVVNNHLMKIHEHLLKEYEKIEQYFPNKEEINSWLMDYSQRNMDHDEPWLTLVSIYSILGNQLSFDSNHIKAMNQLFSGCGIIDFKPIDSIKKASVELKLPEILSYRKYLKDLATKETFHFYPDRIRSINEKKQKTKSSIEGNTNLDLLIKGARDDQEVIFFIESKFLSDIDNKITYNPVRDQIARNIDAGIDYCEKHGIDICNFHFLMLTPKVFRTQTYGGGRTNFSNNFNPEKGRFYCYKMDDYKNPDLLKKALPHRFYIDFTIISKNIGWITFEDIINSASDNNTIDTSQRESIDEFFFNRNLIQ